MAPNAASTRVAGSFAIDVELGGKLSGIEALRIDGSVPQLDLRVSEHELTAPQPLKFGLRDGRFVFDQFTLQGADSAFNITGYAELTGTKRIDVRLRGELEAALLQVFVAGMRADGHVNISGGVTGTLSDPRFTGTTEIRDASVRFTG